jgi:hypothetical protein
LKEKLNERTTLKFGWPIINFEERREKRGGGGKKSTSA